MSDLHYGAFPKDWLLFSEILNLTADLLPTVSRPDAVISESSKLKSLGKTPSLYGSSGVVGIQKWTQKVSTDAEVEIWSGNPDYGICIQARTIRAFDIDVTDNVLTARILAVIAGFGIVFPKRARANSAKCLLPFRLEGVFGKRRMDVGNGNVIEFLGNGQQWVAAGTHPSGSRYELDMNGCADFPVLSAEMFEKIWSALENIFATGKSSEEKAEERKNGERIICDDPRADFLRGNPCYKGENAVNGVIYLECPFKDEHTGDSGDTETVYFVAGTNGYPSGHYKCLHAHCAGRSDGAFDNALGYYVEDFTVDDFESTEPTAGGNDDFDPKAEDKESVFPMFTVGEYKKLPRPGWIIKNWMPRAALMSIYGESGAGKTFVAEDMAVHIANGIPEFLGCKVVQGRVVVIVAEGAGGYRNRIEAYEIHHGITINEKNFQIMPVAPNLLELEDSAKVVRTILRHGGGAAKGADVIFIDTLAQTAVGGDENAAKDMGRVIAHCKLIHKHTGALVVLIHHAGKDIDRGLRGWSGLKGALDANLEVRKGDGEIRTLSVDKMKDGKEGEAWSFRLVDVPLPIEDLDDEQETSSVVEFIGVNTQNKKKEDKMGRHKKVLVTRAFEVAICRAWEDLSPDGEAVSADKLYAKAAGRIVSVAVKTGKKSKFTPKIIEMGLTDGMTNLDMQGLLSIDENNKCTLCGYRLRKES